MEALGAADQLCVHSRLSNERKGATPGAGGGQVASVLGSRKHMDRTPVP
jgi:hypothetical protein